MSTCLALLVLKVRLVRLARLVQQALSQGQLVPLAILDLRVLQDQQVLQVSLEPPAQRVPLGQTALTGRQAQLDLPGRLVRQVRRLP